MRDPTRMNRLQGAQGSAQRTEPLSIGKLTVLMVSYNTRELVLRAVRSLYDNAGYPFELIVIDNASDDGSGAAISSEFSSVKVIQSGVNLGFAAANNEAVKKAQGNVLLFLNPDTEVLPGAIRELMMFRHRNLDARIWGGRTVYGDGRPNPSSCWRRQTLWGLLVQALGLSALCRSCQFLNPERVFELEQSESCRVDIVSGCFLLIDKEFFLRLGGFSSRFFMYGEDADLCLRAESKGARACVTSRATIIHHGGASERVAAEKLIRLLKAKVTLIIMHFTPGTRGIALVLLSAWPFSRMLAHWVLSILGVRRYAITAAVWKEVWGRRKEWLEGFPPE